MCRDSGDTFYSRSYEWLSVDRKTDGSGQRVGEQHIGRLKHKREEEKGASITRIWAGAVWPDSVLDSGTRTYVSFVVTDVSFPARLTTYQRGYRCLPG